MADQEFVASPFSDENLPATTKETGAALIETATQREIAEVQAMMIIAKRYPRDQVQATDRILVACQRPSLAEGALYSYARGGTEITGPSIRMAEALAQNWGNLSFGIRELDQRPGESTVEAYAWDLETNTRQVKIFQVKHVRHTKKGQYALHDPRDIYEMVANQGARRLRACILGVIPGDVVEAAVSQCEATLKSKADTSPEAIKKMVDAFKNFGVDKEMIEKRIQRKLDSITPAQVIALRKIYNSLKDGISAPVDWFELEVPPEPGISQADRLKGKLRKKAADKTQDASSPDPSPTPQPSGEVPPQGITPHQMEDLEKVPLDILEAGYKACGIDAKIPLQELTEKIAADLQVWLREQ